MELGQYSGAKGSLACVVECGESRRKRPGGRQRSRSPMQFVALSDAVQIFHVTTGDVTGNQQVDIGDLVKAAKHYGKTSLTSWIGVKLASSMLTWITASDLQIS